MASSLKTLRIVARLNIGGPARHVVLLEQGLQARGHATLLVYGAVDPGEASLEHLALEARIPSEKLPELGRSISPLSDLRAFARLVRLIFRETPDVVHTHTSKAGSLGRVAALVYNLTRPRRRKAIVVHTFHGHVLSGYFSPLGDRLVRLAERVLASMTDRIVTISTAQRNDIITRFAIASAQRTVVIPLGLDLAALLAQGPEAPDLRRELGINDDLVVGYVGRLVPIKNVTMLIEAFARAQTETPMRLVIVGDGPLKSDLQMRAASLGVASRVTFTGWNENLPAIYATMDVLALSSANEGTPVAIIEAMAAGKGAVATAVGGVPDVIQNEITGLLVPPGDVSAFARALGWVAAHRSEWREIGHVARESVRQKYLPSRLVNDMEQLYLGALADRRGSLVGARQPY